MISFLLSGDAPGDAYEILAEQNHWSERGQATLVRDADALDCPRRSVLALGHMSTSTIIRCVASLALLGSLVAAGYFYMVAGIRQAYFPDEPNGYLFAIIAAFCLLALYFLASMRCGRFFWIMRAPRTHQQRDENDVA